MALVKLAFQPGIQRDGSRYSASGAWSEGDKVRFRQGFPEKIGGWQRATQSAFVGTCRSLHAWSDLNGSYLLGIGTNLKYYVERGGALYDITPLRGAPVTLTGPFSTTSGSRTVTVSDLSHGAYPGDFVTFSGATSVGGLVLNGEYAIQAVPNGDTYTITAASNATSTATGGGTVTATYQINTGLDTTVYSNGYGAGTYGGLVPGGTNTGYGMPAPVLAAGDKLRLWSDDTFGQDLVINVRDGGIYYWAAAGGLATRAVALSALPGSADAPAIARQIITSDADRKVIAFGCTDYVTGVQDRLLIRWSDTENPAVWTPLETNSAGGLRIPTGAEFISAVETKQEILVWSDDALHSMRYVGAPFEYGITRIGFTSIAAPNAAVATNDQTYWMGTQGFYRYDGRIAPLPCSVKDYVFNDINLLQAEKIIAGSNMGFNEVWWFYPSANSQENDRYVSYNYVENVWMIGTIPRTAWIDKSVEDYPRATSPDGYVYFHDIGQDDGSTNPPSPINAYVESGPNEIQQGDQFGFVWRMIPDVTFRNSSANAPRVTMTLKADEFPGGPFDQSRPSGVTRTATVPVEQFTEQTYFRLRGRSVSIRVESTDVGVAWRLGVPRIDVRADGKR